MGIIQKFVLNLKIEPWIYQLLKLNYSAVNRNLQIREPLTDKGKFFLKKKNSNYPILNGNLQNRESLTNKG